MISVTHRYLARHPDTFMVDPVSGLNEAFAAVSKPNNESLFKSCGYADDGSKEWYQKRFGAVQLPVNVL